LRGFDTFDSTVANAANLLRPYARGNPQIQNPRHWNLFVIRIIWRFRAKPDKQNEFLQAYSWKGKWAKLFGRSSEYQGTLLLQDASDPLSYIVIDRWESTESYSRFQQLFAPDYEFLDRQCNELTDEETYLGMFKDEPA